MSRAELLFDSPDWLTVFLLNSQMLFPVPHFLPSTFLHLQLLQQAPLGSWDTVPEVLLGVALPSLF